MKRNWEYKKLGDVCVSKSGIGRALKTFESNDEILYIDIASIDNQKHSITSYTQTKLSEAPSRAQQCVKKEDILVSLVRPNLKNVAIVGDDENNLVASSGFCVLRAGEDLLPQYVFQFVCSDKFTDYLVGLTAGANYPAVREDDVRNAIVPVPPLDEQSRIVAELDLLTGIIDKQNAQLKELDNLAQAIFYGMFGDPIENPKGWEVKKLGELCNVGSSRRIFADEYVESGIPFYRSKEIIEKSKNKPISVELFIREDRYIELKKNNGVPAVGDLLITAVGTIGEIWVVDSEQPFYFKDGNIVWLSRMSPMVDSFFFRFSLEKIIVEYKKKATIGSAYAALTIVNLKKMDVLLPPLALQQSFAEKIQSIEKQKETIRASIADTQKLLDYTMNKYFG